jgi:hypothetical protein
MTPDPGVIEWILEHDAVLNDPATAELIARLPEWNNVAEISVHQHPAFAPNLLGLLADMGFAGGDERIEHLLDTMLDHQLPDGRFAMAATSRVAPERGWGSLSCDTHAIRPVELGEMARVSLRAWRSRGGDYSFGQRKRPSPFATARLLQVLHGFVDLRDESAAVDVTALNVGAARVNR